MKINKNMNKICLLIKRQCNELLTKLSLSNREVKIDTNEF